MVQSNHVTVFCHDTSHHCLSSNSSLENGEIELVHHYRYCRNYKTLDLKSDCVIQLMVGHGLYMQFTKPFPSFVEVGWACKIR